MSSPAANKIPPASRRARIGSLALGGLGLLLVVPIWALSRLATWVDWRVLVSAPVAISAFTFLAYRSDKRSAEAGEWRVPESTLHLFELLGGWPGAFFAQQRFRHKVVKVSYQISFWLIVALHQFVALDSLVGWRFTKQLTQFIRARFA